MNHSAFLEETPTQSFDDIGGLDRKVATLRETVEMHLFHPELVKRYALPRKGSILLVGPPGCGKTLVARALAAHLSALSGGQARFMNVKPGALHSMWYGKAEANYRELFRVAREAATQDPGVPVVVFFDELDAIGGTRGGAQANVDDRIQNAFFVELDGLAARGNVLVIGATNRRKALDPALLRPGRFGDDPIEIPRPGRSAARDILAKQLPENIPYALNGHGDETAARASILDTAVSRLFAPNGEGELARITFRDGKQGGDLARRPHQRRVTGERHTACPGAGVPTRDRERPGRAIRVGHHQRDHRRARPGGRGAHAGQLPASPERATERRRRGGARAGRRPPEPPNGPVFERVVTWSGPVRRGLAEGGSPVRPRDMRERHNGAW